MDVQIDIISARFYLKFLTVNELEIISIPPAFSKTVVIGVSFATEQDI
jgi:hypothetical protein